MTDAQVLEQYTRLIPFLATVLGPGCEVLIHDTQDPNHSIIAIQNSLSGRRIGDPMTDLANEIAARGAYADADYIANYNGRTKGGNFLSSTYYIKNDGRLIGLLCVNKDMSAVRELNNTLRLMLERYELTEPRESAYSESLDSPIGSLLHARVAETISQIGIAPARMSMQEKIMTVQRLKEDGLLAIKGAVAEVASQLEVSVPTVYRYMNAKN